MDRQSRRFVSKRPLGVIMKIEGGRKGKSSGNLSLPVRFRVRVRARVRVRVRVGVKLRVRVREQAKASPPSLQPSPPRTIPPSVTPLSP
jgi:hypothetical protein